MARPVCVSVCPSISPQKVFPISQFQQHLVCRYRSMSAKQWYMYAWSKVKVMGVWILQKWLISKSLSSASIPVRVIKRLMVNYDTPSYRFFIFILVQCHVTFKLRLSYSTFDKRILPLTSTRPAVSYGAYSFSRLCKYFKGNWWVTDTCEANYHGMFISIYRCVVDDYDTDTATVVTERLMSGDKDERIQEIICLQSRILKKIFFSWT